MPDSWSKPVILYDGVCGFCSRIVRFILRHDSRDRFRFASLQSEFAFQILRRHGRDPERPETMYLVLDYSYPTERLLTRSEAGTQLWSSLDKPWSAFGALLHVLPRWLADWGYNLVAQHRHRIFGKYESCPLPESQYRYKFLDLPENAE